MKLAREQWQSLSDLLDEALALPQGERAGWVATLGVDQPLKTLLRDMLERPANVATADLIDTLPGFAPPVSAAEWSTGATVGPYCLVREVGRGGMGAVWLAERVDGLVKRFVALKLPIVAASRANLAERFAREREILAPLAHANIARLYDAGFAADGQPYLALEYVAGEPITAYCDAHRLPVRARIELFRQVLDAVQYAHANLVLHRDLKPSNVLVTPEGDIKLLDFGIAKLMAEGATHETALTRLSGRALTPDYAAPEQIMGASLTTASDVYALGVVLYELLAGHRPYRLKRQTRGELEEAILAQDVPRPSAALDDDAASKRGSTPKKLARLLAGDLDTIVLKALRKAPADRYTTTEAFAQDLDRYLHGQPVTARPDSAGYRARKFLVRNKLAVAAASAVAAALVAGVGVASWEAHVARLESTRANASKDFVDRLFQSAARTNPRGAAAGDTTARELLDLGSAQLLKDTGSDPKLQFDLTLWLAQLNSELDLLEPATRLSDRSIALARETYGASSIQAAEALMRKADTVYRAASYADAIKVAQETLAIAELHPAATLELRGRAHVIIGNSQYQIDTSRTAEPKQHLQTALALLQQAQSKIEDRSRAAYYLAWIAEAEHEFSTAEAYYRDGIEVGRVNFGERSFIVAFGYEGLADMLRQQGRLPQAREAIDKALSIYEFVLGPRHGTVAFARTTLAMIEAAMGDRAEAERVLDGAVALAQDVFGRDARQIAYPLTYAARLKAQRGRLEDAARDYDRVAAVYARTDPPSSRPNRMLPIEHADVLMALGRLQPARAALANAAAAFDASPNVPDSELSRLEIARFALAHLGGDEALARSELDHARKHLDAAKDSEKPLLMLLAAAVARAQPPGAEAQAMLDRLREPGLLPGMPADLQLDLEDRMRLRFAIGRLSLAAGRYDDARSWLTQAVEQRTAMDAPDSPWLAEAQVALAEALIASGRSDEAVALLARASAIEDSRTEPSETFRRPLRNAYALLANSMIARRARAQ